MSDPGERPGKFQIQTAREIVTTVGWPSSPERELWMAHRLVTFIQNFSKLPVASKFMSSEVDSGVWSGRWLAASR